MHYRYWLRFITDFKAINHCFNIDVDFEWIFFMFFALEVFYLGSS
jgi:hypothetical protein